MNASLIFIISIVVISLLALTCYLVRSYKKEGFGGLVGNIDSAHPLSAVKESVAAGHPVQSLKERDIDSEGIQVANMKNLAACRELCTNIDPTTVFNGGKGSLYCTWLCDQAASNGTLPDLTSIEDICDKRERDFNQADGSSDYCVGMTNIVLQALENCNHQITSVYQDTPPSGWGVASANSNNQVSPTCVNDAIKTMLPNLYLGSWIRR